MNQILKILKKHNLPENFTECRKVKLNKYILIYDNEFLFKISINKFETKLSKNEIDAYTFLKSSKFNFQIPLYTNIFVDDYSSISKVEFIKGKQARYFDLKKIYLNNQHFLNEVNIVDYNNYFNIMVKNFKNIFGVDFSTEINKEMDLSKKIFGSEKLKISPSHGDFTHWNCIKMTNNKFCIIDLEYFSKERIFIFDIIQWLIFPIINRLVLLNIIKINFLNFFVFYIKIFLSKKNIFLNKMEIKKYMYLYFLEKKFYYSLNDKIQNSDYVLSNNSKIISVKLHDAFSYYLNKILESKS